ncbi:MAG: hypothetical protein ABSE17_04445 [Candidatus Levyibacteriota bacterium]
MSHTCGTGNGVCCAPANTCSPNGGYCTGNSCPTGQAVDSSLGCGTANEDCCVTQPYCGDGICGVGEDSCTCPADCPGTCTPPPCTCDPACSTYSGACDNNCNEYAPYCRDRNDVCSCQPSTSEIASNTPACNGVVWNGHAVYCPKGYAKGYNDGASCKPSTNVLTLDPNTPAAWGWACDPSSTGTKVPVQVYLDYPRTDSRSIYLGQTTANLNRLESGFVANSQCGDVGHGWSIDIPQYYQGVAHTIYAYGYGTQGGWSLLTQSGTHSAGPCTYNASGDVYVDTDKNGQRCVNGENPDQTSCSGTEAGYTGGATITIYQGNQASGTPFETITTSATDGTFATANATPLPAGDYTAVLTLPSGYQFTSPSSAAFTVGSGGCSAPSYAGCDANGNVINLDFGISNAFPWIQVGCADVMSGAGFSEDIPSTASLSCSGGPYAASTSNPTCTTAGVIYAGSQTPSFGGGQASALDWVVGGIQYPYAYNLPLSNEANTSYVNLSYLVQQANVPTTSLNDSPYCGPGGVADCTLPASLAGFPSGVYTTNGDLKLDSPDGTGGSYTFPSGGNYVILVNGILTINTEIVIPNTTGSFVLFSSAKDTNVTSTVGEATPTVCNPTTNAGCDLEGYYSTDENFNLQGDANCSQNSADLQLNIAGSVVVNAVTTNNGQLNYDSRDLCSGNITCPVLSITQRPSLLLNAPTFLLFPRRVWQEVAP